MTIFSRTVQGQQNLHFFYGVEKIIYIEGESDESKLDKFFYETILEKIIKINLSAVKIYPLGNCQNVYEKYEEIIYNNIHNTFCIIDKDYNNLKFSLLYSNRFLKFSYGYSWECDFWTKELILNLIDLLSGRKLNKKLKIVNDLVDNTLNLACKISRYDLIAQINDTCVLLKNKSTFGIGMKYDQLSGSIISYNEVRRLRRKIVNLSDYRCDIVKNIFNLALKVDKSKIIQGHFWEKISLVLIVESLKILGVKTTMISEELIINIAKSLFSEDAEKLMGQETKVHYINELQPIFS